MTLSPDHYEISDNNNCYENLVGILRLNMAGLQLQHIASTGHTVTPDLVSPLIYLL